MRFNLVCAGLLVCCSLCAIVSVNAKDDTQNSVRSLGDVGPSYLGHDDLPSSALSKLSSMYSDWHFSMSEWVSMGSLWLLKGRHISEDMYRDVLSDSDSLEQVMSDLHRRGQPLVNESEMTESSLMKRLKLLESFEQEFADLLSELERKAGANKVYSQQHQLGVWVSLAPTWMQFGMDAVKQYGDALDNFRESGIQQDQRDQQLEQITQHKRHGHQLEHEHGHGGHRMRPEDIQSLHESLRHDSMNENDTAHDKMDTQHSSWTRAKTAQTRQHGIGGGVSRSHGGVGHPHLNVTEIRAQLFIEIWNADKLECDKFKQLMESIADVKRLQQEIENIHLDMENLLRDQSSPASDLGIVAQLSLLKKSLVLVINTFIDSVRISIADIEGTMLANEHARQYEMMGGFVDRTHLNRSDIMHQTLSRDEERRIESPLSIPLIAHMHSKSQMHHPSTSILVSKPQIQAIRAIDDKTLRQQDHNPSLFNMWLPVGIVALCLGIMVLVAAYDIAQRLRHKNDKPLHESTILGPGGSKSYGSGSEFPAAIDTSSRNILTK